MGPFSASSKDGDLDLLVHGHFAPDMCSASFAISPPKKTATFQRIFHPQIGGTQRGIPYPQGSSFFTKLANFYQPQFISLV